MNPWIAIGALGFVGIAIPLGMMGMSWMLRPSVPEDSKRAPYESGEIPTGSARLRFNIQYYMVALLFVVFDIETVLIFPWTVIYRSALEGGAGLAETLVPMLVFIGVLLVGLAWAWRNGAVEWARSSRAERAAAGIRGEQSRRQRDRARRRRAAEHSRRQREGDRSGTDVTTQGSD
jgi:NADH-quinone oxidoreductase subunit A